jgi:quinol monooxygenase YgiN
MIEEDDMGTNIPSVVVTGYVQVAPNDGDTFIKVLQAHIPRVRRKDGCIAYSFAVDVLDPSVVRMSEVWRDQKALATHLADDEFQATMKELAGVEIVARNVQKYEVSSTTDI